MKIQISKLIHDALARVQHTQNLSLPDSVEIQLERTRDEKHGDFACNIALLLSKACNKNPRELAQAIIAEMASSKFVRQVEIAGPGFINIFVSDHALQQIVADVHARGDRFGHNQLGKSTKIHIEYVSANPTGPLHVGHGRGAAFGASLANILEANGYEVHREYYVNDAGRQMAILAASVWLRYLELFGAEFVFPSNAYKGAYVVDIAKAMRDRDGDSYRCETSEIFAGLPADEPAGGDKEEYIDAVVEKAKSILGADRYEKVHAFGLNNILDDIRNDLAEFRVTYQEWFSEKSLSTSGAVEAAIKKLDEAGCTYLKDGAKWFNATHFGDEKDRVLVRANGQITYFASDVAYHMNKFDRGFDRVIDILGADHHGYYTRVKASLEALGKNPEHLSVNLVQFAILYRGGDRVQMSTRSGSFVTLRELRDEVGNDAARFFYVMRKAEQHMDFDLDLAKSQSNDNPVYYIQYAHARVSSVMRQLVEKKYEYDQQQGAASLDQLVQPHEKQLMTMLSRYNEVIAMSATAREPHQLAHYLRELANVFHTYYNAHQFIVEDAALRNARLYLISATQIVLRNGLVLLGVNAPEQM